MREPPVVPEKDPPSDVAVEEAVRRLLQATQQFAHAYEAWVEAPRTVADDRLSALDRAERLLEAAKHDVAAAQLRRSD